MKTVWEMAKTGEWTEPNKESLKIISSQISEVDEDGMTALHKAAVYGKLECVPKAFLTKKNLLKKDKEGKTVLHYAILDIQNGLENLPEGILCKETMLLKDINGNNLYHMLGYSKGLNKIDRSLLKEDALMSPNELGITPIEYICYGGNKTETHLKKDSLDFFKGVIQKFSKSNLTELKKRGAIKEEFGDLLDEELKKRAIANELAKGENTLELT